MFHIRTGRIQAGNRRVRPLLETLEDRCVPADVLASYHLAQDWGSGFQGQIELVNQQASTVSGWVLEFDLAANITSLWDGRIVSQTGNHYVVTHAGWNSTLAAGGSVSFGFVASPTSTGPTPTDYLLNGAPLDGSAPELTTLSIGDVDIVEGNSGSRNAVFTVSLSGPSATPVTVGYRTVDGTARSGSDYTATSGSLTFAPGETQRTITVAVLGDTNVEGDESFTLELLAPTGATLARNQGTATVRNDDASPPPPTGGFEYRLVSDWGSGFTGEVSYRNTSAQPLTGWRVEFDFAGQISSLWNGTILSHTGNHYVVGSVGWNDTIAAGGTLSFGFVGSATTPGATPTGFRLGGTGGDSGGDGGTTTNHAPVGTGDTATTRMDRTVTIAVLANDSDPDGDPLGVQSVTQGQHGTVVIQADGTLIYTPTAGYTGTDVFQYTLADGRGGTGTAEVALTVLAESNSTWPAQFSAAYVDATLWPTYDFAAVARDSGVRFFTLAFIVADSTGQPAWGGYSEYAVGGGGSFDAGMRSQIDAVRQLGGDVMVSFGGAANRELAEVHTSVASLKAAYRRVIDAYDLTHLDFDIEGAATADRASIDRRSQALAELQQEYRAAGKELQIWFTLPVLPTGLTPDGLYVVQSALAHGLDPAGVNIMAMDYGDSAAPNPQGRMGDYAIQAATSLHAQLTAAYGGALSSAEVWGKIGVTPMIGLNDVTTEVFDLQEAAELLAFAEQQGIARLSMWSLNRDQQNPNGVLTYVDLKSSSILQTPLAFTLLFEQING